MARNKCWRRVNWGEEMSRDVPKIGDGPLPHCDLKAGLHIRSGGRSPFLARRQD